MPFTDPFVANPYPYAYALQAPLANSFYYANQSLVPGVYTIQSNTTNSSIVYLYNGNTLVASYTITSTSQIVYIPSAVTEIVWNSPSSTNATFYLSLIAIIDAGLNATLYTLTTNGTWSITCKAYVIAIGGGGGGGGVGYVNGSQHYGGGGASGGVLTTDLVNLTAGTPYTIGQGGPAGNTVAGAGLGTAGTAGTATVFGSYTANGGGGGQPNSTDTTAALGGTPNGGNGGYGSTAGTLSVSQVSVLYSSGVTTSGGSPGINNGSGIAAPTGTLGTGATGAWTNGGASQGNASSATGYGAGGGGAAHFNLSFGTASAGTNGVLIILAPP